MRLTKGACAMSYDFDTPIDRRNTNSLKWNVPEGELPMWVADMDFAAAPEIRAAILARAEHGVFGYTDVPDNWYQAYQTWWQTRHGFAIERQWLIFCTGVVPAISSIVRKLTTPAEKVLIQTPVYNIFLNSILKNGRQVLENPLHYDGDEYRMDFEDLERKLADPQTTLMILSNPHNPVGRIWDRETLGRIGALCRKYGVTVVSDEIHCDLTAPGLGYVPFASVSEDCRACNVTCIAPTKAFNLAGLQTAAVVVPDDRLRHKVWRGLNTDEVAEPNAFAIDAAVAAFTQGGPWLDALRLYIQRNKATAAQYIADLIPQLRAVPSQATYLLWLDCGQGRTDAGQIAAHLRAETGLYLSPGGQYGGNGERFLRMNLACPYAVVNDGLERLRRGMASYAAGR